MPHHGPVQPVLGHDAPPAPGLAGLPLLGSPVLEPNLRECAVCQMSRIVYDGRLTLFPLTGRDR